MGGARCVSALVGACLAAVLPHTLLRFPITRAAWCWDLAPPHCKVTLAGTKGGICKGATDGRIPAGAVCDIECPDGLEADGDQNSCPPSGGEQPSCFDDLSRIWWNTCGFEKDCPACSCKEDHVLDATWSCVAAGTGTLKVATPAPPPVDPTESWDAAVVVFVACLAALPLICSLLVLPPFLKSFGIYRALTQPRIPKYGVKNWTWANVIMILLVALGLALWVIILSADIPEGTTLLVFLLGLAAGIATPLPMWWSFFKLGVHNFFGISREAAWKVHVLTGALAIIVGGIHGIVAIIQIEGVFDNTWWTLGFVGWLFMLVGVFPADIHLGLPRLLTYDMFKLGHFASLIGFVLALLHMGDHALKFGTTRSWLLFLFNAAALLGFVVQKTWVQVKKFMDGACLQEAETKTDSGGTHVFLKLDARKFKYQPGQWAHLVTPLSQVPHPFTIVPGENGSVQFFIKTNGKFTQKLANACSSQPKMRLEGPYGIPPLPASHINAVVFVVGGVGVTPVLSLASVAKQQCGDRVHLFWNCRSIELIQRCLPMLESTIELQNRKICLTGKEPLPEELEENQSVTKGRADLAEFLDIKCQEIAASAGGRGALLFVCGPIALAASVKAAVKKLEAGVSWTIHVEEFNFLPRMNQGGDRAKAQPLAQTVGAGQEKDV